MASVIDSHPQRDKIVDAILAGRSLRDIAASVSPAVSVAAVHRYRVKHVAPTLANAATLQKVLQGHGLQTPDGQDTELGTQAKQLTQAALAADPLLARIARHQQTIDGSIQEAQAEKDGRTIASLIGTDLKGLELHARLTGRLDSNAGSGNQVAIVINCSGERPAARPTDGGVTIDIGK